MLCEPCGQVYLRILPVMENPSQSHLVEMKQLVIKPKSATNSNQMKCNRFIMTAMSLFLFSCSTPTDEESKIDGLLSKMTLEEKAAQMLNLGLPRC